MGQPSGEGESKEPAIPIPKEELFLRAVNNHDLLEVKRLLMKHKSLNVNAELKSVRVRTRTVVFV